MHADDDTERPGTRRIDSGDRRSVPEHRRGVSGRQPATVAHHVDEPSHCLFGDGRSQAGHLSAKPIIPSNALDVRVELLALEIGVLATSNSTSNSPSFRSPSAPMRQNAAASFFHPSCMAHRQRQQAKYANCCLGPVIICSQARSGSPDPPSRTRARPQRRTSTSVRPER
jgi:hypothetical protein